MNRCALVTGSSRGIGKATAVALAQKGFNVVVNCVKNTDMGKAVADELCGYGVRAGFFCADVSDAQAVGKLYEYAHINFGFVDTVVNNAGISRYALFQDEDESSFDKVMGVNLRGVFNVTKAFLPDMISNKFGRIINISSMWGLCGASCEVLYSASKAAVIGLGKALSKELGPSGITVNAVAPGVIKTDMLNSVGADTIRELVEATPLGRVGIPSDVASVVTFLASKESGFVTGEVINCSGGFVM